MDGDAAAGEAYARWSESPAEQETRSFSAYLAALDQEESAATAYAAVVRDLERWLHRQARSRS